MSGCFIKCPRCKTGHMREMNNMIIGKKTRGAASEFYGSANAPSNSLKLNGIKCNRCGFIIHR